MANWQNNKVSRGDFEGWLRRGPKENAQVIAMRLTLRLMPLLTHALSVPAVMFSQQRQDRLVLSAFRAAYVSWAACRYPQLVLSDAAKSAGKVAADMATELATTRPKRDAAVGSAVAYCAADAAYAVGTQHGFVPSAAIRSIEAAWTALTQADHPDTQLWREMEADANWLQDLEHTKNKPELGYTLANAALWRNNDSDWFNESTNRLVSGLLERDGNWSPWIIWLNEQSSIAPRKGMHPELSGVEMEHFDQLLVSQEDSWWQRDPAEVNADIAGWIEEAHYAWFNPNDDPGPELDADGDPNENYDDEWAEPIPIEPSAGPGPQYQVQNGKLSAQVHSPPADEFAPQMALHRNLSRLAEGLAIELMRVGNRYPQLANAAIEYAELMRTDISELDVVGLWSVGGSLASFAEAFREQNVARTLEDPLEPQVAAQLQSLVRQHGAFILGFSEGRELVERADEFALDRDRLAEIQVSGDALINELTDNRDLVDDRTRALHRPVRDALIEFGWGSARRGYAGYLIVRNGTRGLAKFVVGSELSVGSVLGAAGGISWLVGHPNPDAIMAMLPYFRDQAQNLLVFFNHSPEMRSYVEWVLHLLKIDTSRDRSENK